MIVRDSFSKKLTMSVSKQLSRELMEFGSLCACAGIQNSPKQAKKARISHYGSFSRSIPPRRYIQAATHNFRGTQYGDEIKRIIVKGIHDNPSPHTQVTASPEVDPNTGVVKPSYVVEGTAKHGTPVFAGRSGGPGLLAKIAKQMEVNQYNAISELNIIGKKKNADSTIAIKGFDHPLEWTHELENSIKSWVARQ